MPSKVWHDFLESAHSNPAENCGLEGEPLLSLLGLIVQVLKMSFISGIKRSLSSKEQWMDVIKLMVHSGNDSET